MAFYARCFNTIEPKPFAILWPPRRGVAVQRAIGEPPVRERIQGDRWAFESVAYFLRPDFGSRTQGRTDMSVSTILIIVLILILIGALPTWPYSSGWGYYPVGGLGLVLLIVIILLLMGRL